VCSHNFRCGSVAALKSVVRIPDNSLPRHRVRRRRICWFRDRIVCRCGGTIGKVPVSLWSLESASRYRFSCSDDLIFKQRTECSFAADVPLNTIGNEPSQIDRYGIAEPLQPKTPDLWPCRSRVCEGLGRTQKNNVSFFFGPL
jgi:hypothetical protein